MSSDLVHVLLAQAQQKQFQILVHALMDSNDQARANIKEYTKRFKETQALIDEAKGIATSEKTIKLGRRPVQEKEKENSKSIMVEFNKDYLFMIPVDALSFNRRIKNILRVGNVSTVGDLIRIPEADLLKMIHMGPKFIAEIRKVLSTIGLDLEHK